LVREKALYAIVATLVAVAILALAALSSQPSSQTTSNPSTSNASSFLVVKTNAIVSYAVECMVLEGIGHTCPTVTTNPLTTPSSFKGVEVIAYEGRDYYAGDLSGIGSFVTGVSTVPYPVVWFTNSSIFCASPLFGKYATCPVNESLPSVSWCSTASNQENPLLTFRISVEYNGTWNATAIGYSNSTANRAIDRCYWGNGNGWVLIEDWNPNGSAILNLTVQKADAGNGNLTVIGGGQVKSTVAPFGAVTISQTAVP
jgi:hypothetical protein